MRSKVADPGKVTLAAEVRGEGGREMRDEGQEKTKEVKDSKKTQWTFNDNPPAKK